MRRCDRRLSPAGVALATLVGCVCLGPSAARAAGIARPTQGTLLLRHRDEVPRPLPLKKTSVRGVIQLGTADVVVRQVFANPTPDPIEAIYVFPLPERAAVSATVVRVGGRVIRGSIAPRAKVRDAYTRARSAGRRVISVDQERANVFTQAVSQIPPGAAVEVELTYHVPLDERSDRYEFQFPMVVAPRSVPGDPSGSFPVGSGRLPDTDRVPDASRITPPVLPSGLRSGRDLDVRLVIEETADLAWVRSPSHPIRRRALGGGRVEVSVPRRARIPNRDLVIRYRLRSSRPRLVIHKQPDGSGFIGLSVPYPTLKRRARAPTVVILLDDTASMSGAAASSAIRVVRELVQSLPRGSRFALVPMTGRRGVSLGMTSRPREAQLSSALRRLRPRRTRDVRRALRKALALAGPSGALVVVSDGWFGNERGLATLVSRTKTHVFPVAIGAAPNRYFAGLLARAGSGATTFVSLGEDPGSAVAALAGMITGPVVDRVQIRWPVPVHSMVPSAGRPLFRGQVHRALARFDRLPRKLPGRIVVDTEVGGTSRRMTLNVDVTRSSGKTAALPYLWARERVAQLELDEIRTGADHRALIAKLGIEFGILTAHTSFIAVDEGQAGRPGARRVLVPVDVPAGVDRAAALADSEISNQTRVDNKEVRERQSTRTHRPTRRRPRKGGYRTREIERKRGRRAGKAKSTKVPPPPMAPSPEGGAAGAEAPTQADDEMADGGEVAGELDEETEETRGEAGKSLPTTGSSAKLVAAESVDHYVARPGRLAYDARVSLGLSLIGQRATAIGASVGVGTSLTRRFALGVDALVLAPIDSDAAPTFALTPALGIRMLPRLLMRLQSGPGLTTDGDFAILSGLGLRVGLTRVLGLELRYERSFVRGGEDADSATLGIGLSF